MISLAENGFFTALNFQDMCQERGQVLHHGFQITGNGFEASGSRDEVRSLSF